MSVAESPSSGIGVNGHWSHSGYKVQPVPIYPNSNLCCHLDEGTIVPNKSDSDVIFCLELLSKILTCTLHLS